MNGSVARLARVFLVLALVAGPAIGALPTPEAHFGHQMGAARKLIEWDDVTSYLRKLANQSDHMRLDEVGKSTEGRPFLVATIARPATLRNLDKYKGVQAKLADARTTSSAEADALAREGKAVVLITCSIHSSEVASTHTAMEFVHKLLSEDTRRNRAILDNVIFLLVPSLNPDGVDKIAQWYKRWVGTDHEGAPLPELYQKYVGHDNNRDWYIFSQQETRLAIEKVHNVWRPQIVYDVHQMRSTAARMFVPPWIDPIDPNIDPLIAQQVNKFGTAMATDLTAAGKKGVVIHAIYDYFTPGRHYQSYHLGMRILTESASARYATPIRVPFSSLQREARGYNAQEASWNFLEPWEGGEWSVRDIVEYQLVAFESCLYNAALHREDLLRNFHRISQRVISRRTPTAFVIPRSQHDPAAMRRLVETLQFGMVEVQTAQADFRAAGRTFREGDLVIDVRQPYGAFAKTLLEIQDYPDLRMYPGGPPRKPYDVTAHSLPLLMGVDVAKIDKPFDAQLAKVDELPKPEGSVAAAAIVEMDSGDSAAWVALNRLFDAGVSVERDSVSGAFVVENEGAARGLLPELASELGIGFRQAAGRPEDRQALAQPRVGLYKGFVPIMDEGWTRWILEQFEFAYENVGNTRLRQGSLRRDFDVIVLPDTQPRTLHAGYFPGALYNGVTVPQEFTGGIGAEGADALRAFMRSGGTVLAFNKASRYAIERLKLGVRDVLEKVPNEEFYAPGSLLYAEIDTSHPLALGMRPTEAVWFESGPVFDVEGIGRGRAVARYPGQDILASGWLLGERKLAQQAAVVDIPVGQGHAILFGVRPQYRAQPNATFKMVFNGLLLGD